MPGKPFVAGTVLGTRMVMSVALEDGTVVDVPGVAQAGTAIRVYADGVRNVATPTLVGYQRYTLAHGQKTRLRMLSTPRPCQAQPRPELEPAS